MRTSSRPVRLPFPRDLAVVVLLSLGAITLTGCDRLQSFFIDRAAQQAAAGDRTDWLEDGALHVILCGTGTPLADPERAGPCTAVIAGGKFFLFDVGPGSWENIQLWRLPRARLSAVVLTHFHSDHIGDLGETVTQSWIAGRAEPLAIYGPPGLDDVVAGFQKAYAHDADYRVAHHGEEAMPRRGDLAMARTVPLPDTADGERVVFDEGGVRITAFNVDHRPVEPAFGYRIEYNGRSAVITGDTAKSPNVARYARGADVLVHEALARHMVEQVAPRLEAMGATRLAKLSHDITTYHATPVEAAETAKEANVRMLVLNHLVPAPANAIVRRVFMQGVSDAWDGKVVLGSDGMHFALPNGSTEIVEEQLG
jgi:ribonuclease Z